MSLAVPPFPPSGAFVSSITDSSRLLCEKSNIAISDAAIDRLLLSPAFTQTFTRVSAQHGLAFPLAYPSPLSELNLLCTLSLLNFASGYRAPLHAAAGRGAWDSIRSLVLGLYLAGATNTHTEPLGAAGMKGISEAIVAEWLRVPTHIERPHPTLHGVMVGEPGPLAELVTLITDTLNETGDVLVKGGYPDLGSFVLEALKEGERVKSAEHPGRDLDTVLERLVRAFPAFRDMALIDGQPIYIFKKALFLIHALALRFPSSSSSPFPIPDTTGVPVFADNVLPSLLVQLGVIDLSASALSSIFPQPDPALLEAFLPATPALPKDGAEAKDKTAVADGPVLSESSAYILRAAAVDACERIVARARTIPLDPESDESQNEKGELGWIRELTRPALDMWLWRVAKDRADYRALGRFVLKGTVFF
ncbi:hypothetical protein FIBSPDRAFT_719490 [Athelia psychrophila]|uniref:Queuosine 5'-phosphate N-glycosylase/hydrolase n=1 Tax=Athelia psychrophila TaxID=1759441 RepID=A0A166WZN4_9AGAM|nr:hypothetical protein FIBSPDRAFT_719490 [Fibularhizoctonia sp. CBS 109695]